MASIRLAYLGGGSTRAAGHHGRLHPQPRRALRGLGGRAHRPGRRRTWPSCERLARRMTAARGLDLRFTRDDRSAGRADRCRRRAQQLPAWRLRGPHAGRADPAGAMASSARRPKDRAASSWPCAPSTCCRASSRTLSRSRPGRASSTTRTPSTSWPRPPRSTPASPSPPSARAPTTSRASWPTPPVSTARKISARMVGLNHTTWSVSSDYDGADAMPAIEAAWEGMQRRSGRPLRRPPLRGAGRHDGCHPGPVPALLLLPRRDPRGAAGQGHDPLRGHPVRGARTTGRTTSSRPSADDPRARPDAFARRHLRARAGPRRDR